MTVIVKIVARFWWPTVYIFTNKYYSNAYELFEAKALYSYFKQILIEKFNVLVTTSSSAQSE